VVSVPFPFVSIRFVLFGSVNFLLFEIPSWSLPFFCREIPWFRVFFLSRLPLVSASESLGVVF